MKTPHIANPVYLQGKMLAAHISKRMLVGIIGASLLCVQSTYGAPSNPGAPIHQGGGDNSKCGASCGCDSDAPVVVTGSGGLGGECWFPTGPESPATCTIGSRYFPDYQTLSSLPRYRGFWQPTDTRNVYVIFPAKARKLCEDVENAPQKIVLPDKKALCSNTKALEAALILCHEFGHTRTCESHSNNVMCNDECKQYTANVETLKKCGRGSLVGIGDDQKGFEEFAFRMNWIAGMSVTCGGALGLCVIDQLNNERPSCEAYCFSQPRVSLPPNHQNQRRFLCGQKAFQYGSICRDSAQYFPPRCGDGKCDKGEKKTCPEDCCARYGEAPTPDRPCCPNAPFLRNGECTHRRCAHDGESLISRNDTCCPDAKGATVLWPYDSVCYSCAPPGKKPHAKNPTHSCCGQILGDEDIELINGVCTECVKDGHVKTSSPCCGQLQTYGNVCRGCAQANERPAPGHSCCPNQNLKNEGGVCKVIEPPTPTPTTTPTLTPTNRPNTVPTSTPTSTPTTTPPPTIPQPGDCIGKGEQCNPSGGLTCCVTKGATGLCNPTLRICQ